MLGTQDMAEEKFKKWEKEPQHMAGMVSSSPDSVHFIGEG
jgi:hypothetical protein